MSKDLKNALRSSRDMDEYLEVRSSQEIIDDIKQVATHETLRDQLAGHALAGLLVRASWDDDSDPAKLAQHSYRLADAMLENRAGPLPPIASATL